ncbi:hypothetical protein ACH4F6_00695 [Streptomyces sp. NPDC017936]|uniref:hypothetical protein n=1 Tax=Streptomyces sp. NPDC017936 TaxID=3365016 RepID=UPI0037879D9B
MTTVVSKAPSPPRTGRVRARPAELVLVSLIVSGIATAALYGGAAQQLLATLVGLATAGRLLARRALRRRTGEHDG